MQGVFPAIVINEAQGREANRGSHPAKVAGEILFVSNNPEGRLRPVAGTRETWNCVTVKGIGSAVILALLAGGGGHARSKQDQAEVNVVLVVPSQPVGSQEYRPALNRGCEPLQEGEYRTYGNRWGRYGDICIDRVEVSFEAYPDPSVSYSIQSNRCPDLGRFGRFRRPDNLFEAPVPEQIAIWKRVLAGDLREFARQCGIRLDTGPFVDQRFDRFYVGYGDGWWFDRLDDGFRLTPNVTTNAAETGAY